MDGAVLVNGVDKDKRHYSEHQRCLNLYLEAPPLPDSIATQIFGLKFSDAPGKAFMIAKDVVLAADDSFEQLQEKLKTFVPRSTVLVQVPESLLLWAGGYRLQSAGHGVRAR